VRDGSRTCTHALLQGAGLAPRIYFSGRHSAAPDTPKASRAEGATRGWTAVAGIVYCGLS